MKIAVLTVAAMCLGFAACTQPKKVASQKHYPLTGKVVSIDAKEHTATIDASAIPDFMGPMKMDYPIPAASDWATLKAGEDISATVNVSDDGSYSLSGIHERHGVTGK